MYSANCCVATQRLAVDHDTATSQEVDVSMKTDDSDFYSLTRRL